MGGRSCMSYHRFQPWRVVYLNFPDSSRASAEALMNVTSNFIGIDLVERLETTNCRLALGCSIVVFFVDKSEYSHSVMMPSSKVNLGSYEKYIERWTGT